MESTCLLLLCASFTLVRGFGFSSYEEEVVPMTSMKRNDGGMQMPYGQPPQQSPYQNAPVKRMYQSPYEAAVQPSLETSYQQPYGSPYQNRNQPAYQRPQMPQPPYQNSFQRPSQAPYRENARSPYPNGVQPTYHKQQQRPSQSPCQARRPTLAQEWPESGPNGLQRRSSNSDNMARYDNSPDAFVIRSGFEKSTAEKRSSDGKSEKRSSLSQ